jgi:hypothetical protein
VEGKINLGLCVKRFFYFSEIFHFYSPNLENLARSESSALHGKAVAADASERWAPSPCWLQQTLFRLKVELRRSHLPPVTLPFSQLDCCLQRPKLPLSLCFFAFEKFDIL